MPEFTKEELDAIWEAAYSASGDPSVPIETAALLISVMEKIKPEQDD